MGKLTIYHGSDHIIKKPEFGIGNAHNDYGLGFYCTLDLDMAKEWANKNTYSGIVNKYTINISGLKILDLTNKNDFNVLHWIAILLHYRNIGAVNKERYQRRLKFIEEHYYVDISEYDAVIGFRADDAYFKFPMLFVQNELSLDAINEIYNLGNSGKQFVILSTSAFSKIKYTSSIEVDFSFHDRFIKRKNDADKRFEEISIKEINTNSKKIEDLLKEYDKRQ